MKTPMNEPITMFKKQFNFLRMEDPDRAYCRKYGCKDSEAESRNEDTDLSAEPELEKQCEDD